MTGGALISDRCRLIRTGDRCRLIRTGGAGAEACFLPVLTGLLALGFAVSLLDLPLLRCDLALVDTPPNDPGSRRSKVRL